MIKAFLSHSWTDKEFVRAIARQLGRQFCIFDEQGFDNAETFKKSIETHLDATAIFVLIATKDALERVWVDFEVQEAWYRMLQRQITKALVIFIDSSLQPSDLPAWLNRSKIVRCNSAVMVAREIRHHIDEHIREQQHSSFEGRTTELEEIQRLLTPIGEPPPRILGISGLPAIGRRTFLKKAVQLNLSFNRIVPIAVGEGDTVQDVTIKVANAIEPYATEAGFRHIVDSIKKSSPEINVTRIVNDLKIAVGNKEMPVLVDEGGVLTVEGELAPNVKSILNAVSQEPDIYLFLICTRKSRDGVPFLPLRPLSLEHIKRLITKLAGDLINISPHQVTELAEYVNGYPPSAYYAVDLVKTYGIDAVLADKNRLVQFRSVAFVRHLKEKTLTDLQKLILLVLARYSPIPLEVIVDTLKIERSDLAIGVMGLIDHSLIIPSANGLYAIAEPIAEAVISEFRTEDDIDHVAVFESLKRFLASEDEELPRLDLHRAFFRAAIRSHSSDPMVIKMANDLIQLAEDYYHRRDYHRCIETARLALQEAPLSNSASDYLIRALIQDEQWEVAEKELLEYEKRGSRRDTEFLRGFLQRKKGQQKIAIQHFLTAEKLGRSGLALMREIANCYFLLDDLPAAKQYINEILTRNSNRDTRYALDLAVQIACREGDEPVARSGLARMESVDADAFVKHRLSTLELRFGNPQRALKAAHEAVSLDRRPTFGMLVQLATCQTRTGDLEGAEVTIQRISKSYSNKRQDIRLGLECRVEIERKRYSKAIVLLERMNNKDITVYKAMRRDALAGELATAALNDDKRIQYQNEVEALNGDLATVDFGAAWLKLVQ